ncbi:hypothetical protein BLOT_007808 [Blomia tropicalis]|nr:hypothetical protein BLOT_007808 [Blomia tropicalis]
MSSYDRNKLVSFLFQYNLNDLHSLHFASMTTKSTEYNDDGVVECVRILAKCPVVEFRLNEFSSSSSE